MNLNTENFNKIFQEAIKNYHLRDDINQPFLTPYENEKDFDAILYRKCWIDTVQWHLEDLVRDPELPASEGMKYKKRIDNLNQMRTDLVEQIDQYIFEQFKDTTPLPDARLNTETPGWAIDRLSILNLKIYHWKQESEREDATDEERQFAKDKLAILYEQQKDLSTAITQLFDELRQGKVIAKTYKQLKMYNDPKLNPVLRKRGKSNGMFNNYFENNN